MIKKNHEHSCADCLCSFNIETTWHMQCKFALDCWQLSGLREKLEAGALLVDSLADFLLLMVGACSKWHRPAGGAIKVNVDAAQFSDTCQTGPGMVIRDDRGEFIEARSVLFHGVIQADET